jgi:hypothetical protein
MTVRPPVCRTGDEARGRPRASSDAYCAKAPLGEPINVVLVVGTGAVVVVVCDTGSVVLVVDGAGCVVVETPQPDWHKANASRQACRPVADASVQAPMQPGLSAAPRQSLMQPR